MTNLQTENQTMENSIQKYKGKHVSLETTIDGTITISQALLDWYIEKNANCPSHFNIYSVPYTRGTRMMQYIYMLEYKATKQNYPSTKKTLSSYIMSLKKKQVMEKLKYFKDKNNTPEKSSKKTNYT